jgi:hypothetical protein
MMTLERWSLIGLDGAKPLAVRGEIHGDERFSDGTPITSSRLSHLDPAGHFACTRNHTYELGAMSDAFARWMAANGRTIASFATALEAKTPSQAAKSRTAPSGAASEATRVVPAATRVIPAATNVLAAATRAATALVQTPTVVANG